MTSTILSIIGLSANILGTVLLAFSLNAYIKSLQLAIDAHELFIVSYLSPNKPIFQVTGTDIHMKRGKKRASFISWLGVIFVIVGFALQIGVYLF